MIKSIVFDIGGVFLHPSHTHHEDLWKKVEIDDPAAGDNAMFGDELWDAYKRGGMTEQEYWQRLIRVLPANYAGSWSELCALFEHSVELDTDLVELTRRLKSNYRIHALSNAGAELERRLKHYNIEDLFEQVINSYYVKMAKPDEAIYRYMSEQAQEKPEHILFVDDKERNTRVADTLGFHTHIYTNAQEFERILLKEAVQKASIQIE